MEYKQNLDSSIARVLEKNTQENFGNILLFCPTRIQENSRKRQNINKLLSNDPLINEFIKLDYQISVNKDDEEVREFSEAIFNFLNSLIELVKFVHKEFNFRVVSTGSFPVSNKIGDIDEFDFVLFWEDFSEQYKLEDLRTGERPFKHLLNTYEPEIIDLIKRVLTLCKEYDKVSEIRLFWKNHAINIEFCWFCCLSHKHSVSLDLAISVKTTTTLQEYYRLGNLTLKNTPFEQSIDCNENIYWNELLDSGDARVDTNVFDKQFFETCDALSPNIKLCFRIIKLVRDCFFPCLWKKRKDLVSDRKEYYITQVFPSYLLKQVLFQEVIEFQCSEEWKNNCIRLRIASMLRKCIHGGGFKDLLRTCCSVPKWIAPRGTRKSFKPIFNKLILSLENAYTEHSIESAKLEDYFVKNMIVVMENNVLIKVPKSVSFDDLIDADCNKYFSLVKFSTAASKVFDNRIFRGLCNSMTDIMESMDLLDLTVFNGKDQGKIFVLLLFSVIKKEEIISKNYLKKLNAFNKMLDSYGMLYNGSVFLEKDYYRNVGLESLDISKNKPLSEMMNKKSYPIFIRWEKIFSRITWKERGDIYQYIRDLRWYERALEDGDPVQQFLVEVLDISCGPGYICRDDLRLLGYLWLLISLNFLKNLE